MSAMVFFANDALKPQTLTFFHPTPKLLAPLVTLPTHVVRTPRAREHLLTFFRRVIVPETCSCRPVSE